MHQELETLLELQAKDLVLHELETRRQGLLAEVATLDDELARARGALDAARRLVDDRVKRRVDVEAKVEGLRVLQERRRQRVEMAKTSRELQALSNELELARSVLAREENEWFRAAEAVTAGEQEVESATARLSELGESRQADREELTARIAALESEIETAREARREVTDRLGRALLQRYERLRQTRTSAVVVALRNDACGACFTAIPMSRRNHIRLGVSLDGCEACGVILYAADDGAA